MRPLSLTLRQGAIRWIRRRLIFSLTPQPVATRRSWPGGKRVLRRISVEKFSLSQNFLPNSVG